MSSALAATSEPKKSKAPAHEDLASDPPQLQHSAGSRAGLPRFMRSASAAHPQVQAKCAKCQEEEEEQKTAPVVQAKCACCGGGSCEHDAPSEGIHSTAREGVAEASEPLPHIDQIQSSFGRHDVTSARAAIGGPAARANSRMGSLAYTAGDRIAFSGQPEVKLAAHEATHIVQQRSGAKLPGGVGRPGDEYERQADTVAEAVDRGESAEPILDRMSSAGPTAAAPVVLQQLRVSAIHQFEPDLAPQGPAASPQPETMPGGGSGKPSSPGSAAAKGGAQAGQTALAAAEPAAPAPVGPAPAPAGGVVAQEDGSGVFAPHCYNAAIDEPKDDDGDEPADPPVPKPEEKVHADLPKPYELDVCPIDKAVQAQAPAAAPSVGGTSAAAPSSGTPAAASPAPQPSDGGQPAADAEPIAGAGMSEDQIQDGAQTAASAPSPLEAAIAQSETDRGAAVSSFETSNASTQELAPRIAALSSNVSFLPGPPSGADAELSRAAETRASEFFSNAAARLSESLTLVTGEVPDNLGAQADTIKGDIDSAIDQQKSTVSANVDAARAQAFAAAQSARAQTNAEYSSTVAIIGQQTDAGIDALTASHLETLGDIDESQSSSLEEVNGLYSDSYDAHVALGPKYADLADARGEQYADFFENGPCRLKDEDGSPKKDSFFAGYLTNRRADAGAKAARETAKGYRKSLIEAAQDSAATATKGRRMDRCGIIATARRTRQAIDDRLSTLIQALRSGQEESVAQAAATRHNTLASIDSGLTSALAAMDLLEHTGRQSLDDTGYLQQLAVEQAAYASATAVQEAVAQAVTSVEAALSSVRSSLAQSPAPAPDDLEAILAQASTGFNGGMNTVLSSVDGSVAAATARLEEAGSGAIAALDSDAQNSFQRISDQSDSFSSQTDSLASGAATAFGALRDQYSEQVSQTAEMGAEGFQQASIGFDQACDTMLTSIGATLGESEKGLENDFKNKIGGLDSTTSGIPKQAADAASKEQPAWKSVVAIVLIIAIIIVVALVIGPAVIGAVGAAAAALGASAGVAAAVGAIVGGAIVGAVSSGAMTVVQNWESGQRLTKGLGHAMLVGALTGAAGGAIGLGVNAGLNAVLSGGRFALSAGAQFAVRAAVNIASDTLMNVGQQLIMTGQVDWTEVGKGLIMSVIMHGSRRVQAFQGRMTAVGARGVATTVSAVGGGAEPSTIAARANAHAAEMEAHAATAAKDAKESLDWTKPPAKSAASTEVTPTQTVEEPALPPTEAAPVKPPETAPVKPAAAPEAVAPPEPVEPAIKPVTEEHPSSAAVDEAQTAKSEVPVADPESPAKIGSAPEAVTEVGVGDHKMFVRRGPDGIEVGMCSGVCGPLKARIEEFQKVVAEADPEMHARLEDLKTAATELEQKVESGEIPEGQVETEVQKLTEQLRASAEEHPLLKHLLEDPTVDAAAANTDTTPTKTVTDPTPVSEPAVVPTEEKLPIEPQSDETSEKPKTEEASAKEPEVTPKPAAKKLSPLRSKPASETVKNAAAEHLVRRFGLNGEQAKAVVEGAMGRGSDIVIGGSRVRGNAHPGSDIDIGYNGLTTSQAKVVTERIAKAQGSTGLKVEEDIRIVRGNQTKTIAEMQSAEEFFMREGVRVPPDPKAGQPIEPSGYVKYSTDGSIIEVRPDGTKIIIQEATESNPILPSD